MKKKKVQPIVEKTEKDIETEHLTALKQQLTEYQPDIQKNSPMKDNAVRVFRGKSFRNTFLAIIGLIILGGYVLFFTSTFWLPYTGSYAFTPLESTITFANKRMVTLDRWDYSPEQGIMEIEMEIDNPNFDGIDNYVCDAVIRTGTGEQRGKVKTIVAQDDFFVLHILNVPKGFTELSLRIQVNDAAVPGTAKLFSNKNNIRHVEHLSAKTKAEYLKDRVISLVKQYNDEISALKETNIQLQDKIQNIQKKNAQLEEKKKYQTEQDIETTNNRISANEKQIQSVQEQIIINESSISEYELKIKKAQKKAAAIDTEIKKKNQMQAEEISEEFDSMAAQENSSV